MNGLAADPRVRFVVVPFVPAHQPALGVSSLVAVLERAGIGGDVRYLNLSYGEELGWKLYSYLTDVVPTPFLPWDMVFSQALWGDRAPDVVSYEERVEQWIRQAAAGGEAGLRAMLAEWERHAEVVRAAVADAPRIVSGWADEVLAGRPRVLGFTSLNDIRIVDRKGNLRAGMQSRTRQWRSTARDDRGPRPYYGGRARQRSNSFAMPARSGQNERAGSTCETHSAYSK